MKRVCLTTIIVVAAVALAGLARAQLFGPKMKKANELIQKQAPVKMNQDLLKQATADNTHIVVSIPKQRAYLMIGEEIVADAPVSSGKRGHETPRGHFNVMEKDPNHHSSLYGDFVDHSGRVVRAGVSAHIDSAPSGTHFAGAAMKWFLRLTGEGVGMHIGILPGYPASHGCIRESIDGAKLFYDHAKVGTPVDVGDF
jgi:lipoprotein-anchoring transpeptidase ErfK/SrfK